MSEDTKEVQTPEPIEKLALSDIGEKKATPELIKEFSDAYDKANPKPVEEKKEPELSETEQEAVKMGWKPKGQFDEGKEGRRHLSAEEYIDRRSFYEKIDGQKKKINNLEKVIKDLGEHLRKTEEAAYQKALAELNQKRNEAIKNQDMAAFQATEQQMLNYYKQQQELQQTVPKIELEPETPRQPTMPALSFYNRNKHWFNEESAENKQMVEVAKQAEQYYIAQHGSSSEKDVLEFVENEMKRSYPHRFYNPKRDESSPVATNTTKGNSGSKSAASRMTEQQRKYAEGLIRLGAYKTIDEYAKDLELQGALKND